MPLHSLKCTNVGPFNEIEFEFDEQVNVFAGPNNTGKSTVLMVLASTAVYPFNFPKKLLKKSDAAFELWLDKGKSITPYIGTLPLDTADNVSRLVDILKSVGYSNFIPALRQSTDFRSKGPMTDWEESTIFFPNYPELKKRQTLLQSNTMLVNDAAVIQKIIELDYTAYRRKEDSIRNLIERIGTVASEITEGFPIRFLGVGEDEDGLFPQFETPDGNMPLNVLSQGTQSILQFVAHLILGYAEYYDYAPNLEEMPGILIIDEIDAHLHPSWQRHILPTLMEYFPNLQIFCSTHSPLMLAGLKAGQVQLLHRNAQGNVTVTRNEVDIVGWSADEILRNFLDISDPTDLETIGNI